jgi:hypothetical protein
MSEKRDALHKWPTIRLVKPTIEYNLIMVGRHSAVIVPRRTFSSDSKANQFLAEIQNRSDAATVEKTDG